MVTLSCTDGSIQSNCLPAAIDSLLRDFSDVFRGVPLVRGGVSHTFPLVNGAKPPFKPMYRLSNSK